MNVTVVGTGYVGLVTGTCLAESGHQVVCVDNDAAKVAELKKGNSPIYEPGLVEMMRRNTERGRLSFTMDLADGVTQAEAVFLALPTPPQDDGSADLSAVLGVAKQLGPALPKTYCVVINKSTVPVGTAEAVRQAIEQNGGENFDVVSNPEFLREGHAVVDFMEPERIVAGVGSKAAEDAMRKLYEPFINEERLFLVTDPATAELAKYASNSFLVTKVSFMNEMSHLSEAFGADIDMLRQIVGSDSRIGHKFLYPGIGAGGSCFPKDIRALEHMSSSIDYEFKLLRAAMAVNEQQQHVLVSKLLDHFENKIAGKTFALWGLAFKPQTDDIREAPALAIIDELLAKGAEVIAYDPEAAANVQSKYQDKAGIKIVDDKYEALGGASALLIATEWPEFAEADLAKVKSSLGEAVIFDGRNVFQPEKMKQAGFSYYSIGRRPVII